MKRSLIFFLALFISASTFAQQKVAHINAQEVLQAMPEFKLANDSLKLLATSIQGELASLESEFNTKLEYYEKNVNGMSAAMRGIKEQELQQMKTNFETYQRSSQNEMLQREETVLAPLETKIMAAIDAVAKAGGYAYVIDASMLIYSTKGDDLGPAVRKHLGIKEPVKGGK